MEIKSRKTEKKLKQQICRLNDVLSFLSNIWQNRNWNQKIKMEFKTTNFSF